MQRLLLLAQFAAKQKQAVTEISKETGLSEADVEVALRLFNLAVEKGYVKADAAALADRYEADRKAGRDAQDAEAAVRDHIRRRRVVTRQRRGG